MSKSKWYLNFFFLSGTNRQNVINIKNAKNSQVWPRKMISLTIAVNIIKHGMSVIRNLKNYNTTFLGKKLYAPY